ncbi:MAG: hypothetical protein JKY33_04105, partial [Bacteroidia bacterium]|nr:hypothetical protein [Bacteroidia bacterium]
SVYFILQAITKNSIPYLVLGGLFIFLSSFCKGIQGLFPITSVFIYWLITKNISLKKMLSFSIILIAIPTVIYLLLFTHDAVIASYSAYFQDRLVGTFQKEHIATTTNRLYLLYRLLCELLPAIAICILITIINNRCKTPKLANPNLKTAIFFILLGLSGSVPLIVTLEQRGFYLITSIPYFAIGLAIISSFKLAPLLEKISVHTRGFKVLKITSIILLISALSLSGLMLGKTKRHHDILHDVYLIGENIPNFSIIDVPYKIWRIWALQAYFVRHFNIGLDASKQKHKYLMLEKKTNAPKNHIEIPINLRRFKLYQRN